MAEELTQDVVIGGTPGSANGAIPAMPGTAYEIKAAPDQEYTAGGTLQWYVNLPHALPFAIDDVTTDFGADLYDRMMLDPAIRAAIGVLKTSILADGLVLSPAIDDRLDPDFARAGQMVDDAEAMFDNLTSSAIDDVLWDLLDAVPYGNRMAEQTFLLETTFSGKTQYQLAELAVKPRQNVAFVVDAYMRVIGILGRVPGMPFPVQAGTLLADVAHAANLLPRSKFAILTFRPRNTDPRGTSALRPAFSVWNQKVQLAKEYLKYLTQFASPSMLGFAAPQAQPYPQTNADGSPQLDSYGNPVMRTPEQDMVLALQQFANGTAASFPSGALVQVIEQSGSGEAFLNAFQYLDGQITKAILHQKLATEEGQHQTRASSGTHKDILDGVVHQARRPVQRTLRRDVLGVWAHLNYGRDALRLVPHVSLGQTEEEDRAALWTAAATLWKAGYGHESQLTDLDVLLGWPERGIAGATTASVTEVVQAKTAGLIEPITPTEAPPDTPPPPVPDVPEAGGHA